MDELAGWPGVGRGGERQRIVTVVYEVTEDQWAPPSMEMDTETLTESETARGSELH